jgi:hypothetical protein
LIELLFFDFFPPFFFFSFRRVKLNERTYSGEDSEEKLDPNQGVNCVIRILSLDMLPGAGTPLAPLDLQPSWLSSSGVAHSDNSTHQSGTWPQP